MGKADFDQPVTKAKRLLGTVLDAASAECKAAVRALGATTPRPDAAGHMVRRLLQESDLGNPSQFKGQQVEVYWPEDGTWWLARVIKVSVHGQLLRLPLACHVCQLASSRESGSVRDGIAADADICWVMSAAEQQAVPDCV
jgi:hypothetical protein